VPLTMAFARSIHKFQGLSAGPTDAGQLPNMYKYLVVDPDEKKFEGTWPGLLYTIVSRATTLGDENGFGSALYFDASDMDSLPINRYRFKNLLYQEQKKVLQYKRIVKRQKWVDRLHCNKTTPSHEGEDSQRAFLQEMEKGRVMFDTLRHRIEAYVLSRHGTRNDVP